jgi:glycosyltransferase involved in cell wall biosynthesis
MQSCQGHCPSSRGGTLTSPEGPKSDDTRSASAHHVCMLGAFPPPVHGMAWLNYAMREYLRSMGIEVHTVDLSASSLDRRWFARTTRWKKVAGGLVLYADLVFLKKVRTLYLTLSGGYGQVFEIVFILLARLAQARMVIHHHSFAYLIRPSRITSLLCRCCGPQTLHVSGSSAMSQLLHDIYGINNLVDLSNAALVGQQFPCIARVRSSIRTIGFMGNISYEKGISEFLELAKLLEESDITIKVTIAGPFQDPSVEEFVRNRLSTLSRAEYVGAKYGFEKAAYFDDIDVLVFPSKYDNETDPVTVYEAMASGVPVIASERGCLSNVIIPNTGALVPKDQAFVPAAFATIRMWHRSDEDFGHISEAARTRFVEMANQYLVVLGKITSVMLGGSVGAFYNEAWTRPSTGETPPGVKKIEGGSYL